MFFLLIVSTILFSLQYIGFQHQNILYLSLLFKYMKEDLESMNLRMAFLFLSKKLSSSVNFSVFDICQTSGCKVMNSFNNQGNGTQDFTNAKIILTGGCCCCCTSFDLHGIIKLNKYSIVFYFFVSLFIFFNFFSVFGLSQVLVLPIRRRRIPLHF